MSDTQWNFLKGKSVSIARAEGACLYTSEEQEIIDVAGGAIVCNVGHGRPRAVSYTHLTLPTIYSV